MDGPILVQLRPAIESKKPGFENALALGIEVGVDDTNALVVTQIFQSLFLGALPICEMLVVKNDHAAFGRNVRAIRPLRRNQAWSAVFPGRFDEAFEFLTNWHEPYFRFCIGPRLQRPRSGMQ